jgi:5-enolpyruvylshikimate-3-phosphate synthase
VICNRPFVISAIYPEKLRMEPFKYLKKAGYSVSVRLKDEGYEVRWSGGFKNGTGQMVISKNKVSEVIDEIPFIAYMAARAGVCFELKNGDWLRNKETDRIHETVKRMSMFFETVETHDGFAVKGEKKSKKEKFVHSDDHRMEMLSKLMAVDKNIPFTVNDCYNVSFPGFLRMIICLEKDEK